jgi:hypothetical protein
MSDEFILDYTGPELNEKLKTVDNLKETLNEKLVFDKVPTEGSEHLVTSGAIHEALRNTGNGSGTSGNLTAGDLIEIKDGVIRSTLGDISGETEELFEELWSKSVVTEIFEEYSQLYLSKETYDETGFTSAPIPISVGESYDLRIKSFNSDDVIYANALCVDTSVMFGTPAGNALSLFYNADYNDAEGFKITGPGALVVSLIYHEYANGHLTAVHTTEKFIGTISIGHIKTSSIYRVLPENSLVVGRGLSLKNGKISSTFGDPIVSTELKSKYIGSFGIYDNQLSLLEDSNIYKSTYAGTIDDIQNLEDIILLNSPNFVRLEIASYDYDDTTIFTYENAKIVYADTYHEADPVIIVNSNQPKEEILASGFIKLDENKPAFMLAVSYDNAIGKYISVGYLSEKVPDSDKYDIQLFQYVNEIDYVKMPIEALPLDTTEVSGLPDKVPSSLAVQNTIYDAGNKLSNDFYRVLDSRLRTDDKPTYYSSNLITSGAVYDAIPFTKGTNSSIALSAGLSVNQAYPTATGCWIEGRDTRVPSYLANDYYNINLSINKTTTGSGSKQTTTTKVLVTFKCLSEYFAASDKTRVLNELKSSRNVKFNFKDDTSTYYFMNVYSVTELDSATIQLELSFEPEHDRFSTDTAVDAREINEFKIYPYYGTDSHTEGHCTQAYGYAQHVQGKYNIIDTEEKYAHIVGNGESDSERSNAHTLDWEGNACYAGSVTAPAFILTSPSGQQFRLTVSDGGTLSTVAL